MKLEPVALSAHMTDAQIYAGLFECDALERVGYSEEMLQVVRRLIDSAIPEGYVVVPVEDAEDARLGRFVKNFDVQTLELTLERMKYVFSHPEEFPVPPAKEQS